MHGCSPYSLESREADISASWLTSSGAPDAPRPSSTRTRQTEEVMAERWLLIETFGGEGHDEPTVIGVGNTPKRMASLSHVLRRRRSLEDVRAVVARVVASGKPVRSASSDGARVIVADPLIAFSGRVHGVYVWMGDPGSGPPPRDPAGAWSMNLSTD